MASENRDRKDGLGTCWAFLTCGKSSSGGEIKPQSQNLSLQEIFPNRVEDIQAPRKRCTPLRLCIVAILTLGVVAAVVLGLTLSGQDDGDEDDNVLDGSTPTPSAPDNSTSVETSGSPPANPDKLDQVSFRELPSYLPQYSVDLARTDPTSPQAKALAWIHNDSQATDYELYRLQQRYALAVFYYTTNGGAWSNSTGWLTNTSECLWYTYGEYPCTEGERLTSLNFAGNGLVGPIPTELELLVDLKTLSFQHNGISATLHSELYVSIMTCLLYPPPKAYSCPPAPIVAT
jgi:hypothetical protein